MGVMNCARRGCRGILCTRYSSVYGYICDRCFEELAERAVDTDIGRFMESAARPSPGTMRPIVEATFPDTHERY